ncbi:AMP-binding protein [Tsukamurella sp. DT100]|uniref:AMP-binding protein n=1 Tax=Tsukamurella sp. DT100 TaxID=3393415 RepID=UPI003CF26C41
MSAVPEIVRAALGSGLLVPPPPHRWPAVARGLGSGAPGFVALLRVAAARAPGRIALVDDEGALTYGDLLAEVGAAATALHRSHGVAPGETVGVLCRNGRRFVVALLATASLGANVLLLNTDFRGRALAASLEGHAVRLVIADEEFVPALDEIPETTIASSALRDRWGTVDPAPREGRLILLTSGTTGTPRGVPRDPAPSTLLGMTASVIARTGAHVGYRTAVAVPFFHAFGLAALALTLGLGGTVITQSRFDPAVALDRAATHRADALMVVPAMLARILEAAPPESVPPVVLSGGSALLPALADRFTARFGDVLFNGYGSSEVALATLATPDDLLRAPGTVGRPVAGATVRVLDDDGAPVPTGITGRIFVGGRPAVGRYTGGPDKARVGALIATGDLGHLDRHGLLHVAGRDDDMIVSGGENVYPRAVENALAAHAGVADSCALGVADAQYGQRLVALVETADPARPTGDALRDYLRGSLSRFEQPRDIHFVAAVPRNAAGKVDRRAAAALLATLESEGAAR